MTLTNFIKLEYYKLVNYTRKRLGEVMASVDPEDIVHDVAVNIYSKADINYPIENLAGYMYRSIRNRITDYQRRFTRESKKNASTVEQELMHIPDDGPLELEETQQKEDRMEHLAKAMDMLNPEHRFILLKTEFEGQSYKELSDELEIPVGTLLARKHRAIASLRKVMNEFENN